MQHLRDLADHLGAEIAPDDVPAKRQRKTAGALGPPLAEVHDLPESLVGVGQLPFVDQQTGIRLPVENRLLDFVERNDDVFEVRFVEPQRQVRGRQRSRDRDRFPFTPATPSNEGALPEPAATTIGP